MITQIYEIQNPHEAEICINAKVDHIGSILPSQENWQQPMIKEVMRLSSGTKVKNSIIPLFMEIETIYSVLDYYRPHCIHFCENLTDIDGNQKNLDKIIIYQSKIKAKYPEIKIIRSIPIPQQGFFPYFPSLKIATLLEKVSDYFLTDTWLSQSPVNGYIGITGQTVDWKIARKLVQKSNIPVILAGGLSPDNVYSTLIRVAPAGADSCTLTNQMNREGKPIRFKKNSLKVQKFVQEVRRAEQDLLIKGW